VFVVVVGCGRVGSAIARGLIDDGHDVNVVDESAEAFARLGDDFPGSFVQGQALEMTVLLAGGVDRADAFVAATDGDNTNLVIAQIAKERFGIPFVLVRVLDPNRARFYEGRGLTIVCPTQGAIEMMGKLLRSHLVDEPAPS